MQKLSGNGTAFAEVDGELVTYELKEGQQIVVDTGNVLGFETSVKMDIQQVKGLKNKLFGGEGFFNTVLTGPGENPDFRPCSLQCSYGNQTTI